MGAFGLGLLGGFANTTNAALQTHIKDNKDRFDKNLSDALARNVANSDRYDKKAREANEALELMSGLTNGNLDQAASVIKSIGGVGQTQGFVDSYRKASQTNDKLTLDSVVKYIGDQRETDLTNQQAINQLVEPFAFTTPAARVKRTGFAGLFDDPRSIATELPKTLQARGLNPTEVGPLIKLQGATVDYSKLRTPEQQYAGRIAKAKVVDAEDTNEARKIAIKAATKNLGWMTPDHERDILKFAADMASTDATTKTRIQALKTARKYDARTAQAAINASIAASIASKSSDDLTEQYNLLSGEERYYSDQLSEAIEGSNDYMRTARRLTDIRLAKTRIHSDRLSTVGDDTFTNVSVVGAANAINATAMRNAGLKFKQGINGQIEMLKKGSSDKIYQAARNAYSTFRKSFGTSNAKQVTQQLEAMKQSMLNAKDSHISDSINLFFKGSKKSDDDKAVEPRSISNMPKTHSKNGAWNILKRLEPGTVVLINNQESLTHTYNKFGEAGNYGVWNGREVIQRQKYHNEIAPSYSSSSNETDYVR